MAKKNFQVTTKLPPLPEITESELSLFDPGSNDLNMLNLIDEESIRLAGSKLEYYKYYAGEYDPVYMEARNKPIDKDPVIVFGHYDPTPLEENLSEFGIELTNDQIFVFNMTYIERIIGRRPIAGDVIKPRFQEQRYEIFEVQEDSFEAYGIYHLNCFARLLRDNPDVQDTPLTNVSDDDVGGYSRGNI